MFRNKFSLIAASIALAGLISTQAKAQSAPVLGRTSAAEAIAAGAPAGTTTGIDVPLHTDINGNLQTVPSTNPSTTSNQRINAQDGDLVTIGSKADSAGCGVNSVLSCLKQLHTDLIAPTAAGTLTTGISTSAGGFMVGGYDGTVYRHFHVDISGNLIIGSSTITSLLQPTTNASYGNTLVVAAAATPGLLGKASAGNLYGYTFTEGATAGFFALLDLAAVPATTTAITPIECVYVPANTTVRPRQDIPDRYSVGIVGISTSSCTTYTSVTPVAMNLVLQ